MKKLMIAFVFGAIALGSAVAAGMWSNLPIIGGAAYCSSTNNGVCVNTVPAGPSTLTGNELIPTDTQITGGSAPQTALLPITILGAGQSLLQAPLTGATITLTAQTSKLILNPAGTLATLTIQLPAATGLIDGQTLSVGSSQIITALTVTSGPSTSVIGAPTTIATAGSGFTLIYKATSLTAGTWYRLN